MKDFVYDGGVRIIYGTNQKKKWWQKRLQN